MAFLVLLTGNATGFLEMECTSWIFPHDNFNNKTMVHGGSHLWGNRGSALACNWGAVPWHLPKTGLNGNGLISGKALLW